MSNWFRLYSSDILDDPKIAMMSEFEQLLWVKVLCLASDSKIRGVILLTDDEICWSLRIEMEAWKPALAQFMAKGLVEPSSDREGYSIVQWRYNQQLRDRPPAHLWRELRSQVFERDDWTCQYCKIRCVNPHCDHIIPVSRGGSNELDNLATACADCNSRKHNKTPEEWLGVSL